MCQLLFMFVNRESKKKNIKIGNLCNVVHVFNVTNVGMIIYYFQMRKKYYPRS